MSYEGFDQHICQNGHYFEADCHEDDPTCECGSGSAWSNPVDETNCDSNGYIPHEQFQRVRVKEAVVETCSLGFSHVISMAVYRVPRKGELQRYWRNWETGQIEPIAAR